MSVAAELLSLFSLREFINTLIPTFAGSATGAWVAWLLFKRDQKSAYIKNAKNVLLILGIQMNKFSAIKNNFSRYNAEFINQQILPTAYLCDDSDWRLSKNEIVSLHGRGGEENIRVMDSLMYLSKDYDDLILSIKDYNKKIEQKNSELNPQYAEHEVVAQVNFFKNIIIRINKIDFQNHIDALYKHLKKTHPKEKFPYPHVRSEA